MTRRARVVIPGAWSSAAAHCGGREPVSPGLLDLAAWSRLQPPDGNWSESISQPQDEAIVTKLRTWANRGCPLGSDSFISKLERRLRRRLRPKPRGRPNKKGKAS